MLSESKRLFAGPLKDILVSMHEGTLDQTLARALTEGIRNGSFDGDVLKNAEGFRPLPGESTEEWRRRMTKKLGFAALIAAILVGTVVQTLPAALPPQSSGH